MSATFDELREDFARAFEAIGKHNEAQIRFNQLTQDDFRRLWADNAALRDELHALANRVEALTRARLTEPAEVAEKMMPLTIGLEAYMREHRDDCGACRGTGLVQTTGTACSICEGTGKRG